MTERSVTRAAERLGRTQSAVSHSLSRLREQLSDPLLIKAGVRMQPTAFALDLLEQARPMLRRHPARALASAAVRSGHLAAGLPARSVGFHADAVRRTLLTRLRSEAPGVSVEWVSPRDPSLLDLAEGLIDVAIAPARPRMPEGVTGENVGALQWRCFGRKAHPAFRDGGREAWTHWPHLAVRVSDVLTSPVHVAASAAGLARTIAGWVPHFSAIAPILASSDLLATLPAITKAGLGSVRTASRAERFRFLLRRSRISLLWCLGRNGDPEIAWLRDRLRPIIKNKFAGK